MAGLNMTQPLNISTNEQPMSMTSLTNDNKPFKKLKLKTDKAIELGHFKTNLIPSK